MKRGRQIGRQTTCFRENCPLSQVAKIRTFGSGGGGVCLVFLSLFSHHLAPRDKMDGMKGGILFDLLSKNDFLLRVPAVFACIGPGNWCTRRSSVGS